MDHVINDLETMAELKKKHEFLMTPEQLKFFMDASKKYVMITDVKDASEEGHFKFLCDRMLVSGDANIKVAMSRVMMYMGFQKLLRIVSKGIIEVMNNPMTSMMKP